MYSDLTPIFPAESSSRPIALITGASRGIGKAIAETFAQAGYDLILTCRQNREKLETLCKSLSEAYSIQAAAFIGDLGDYETVRELFAPIRRLNLLVNNAGISHIGLLSDMTLEEWGRVIDTNLNSCFYLSHELIPQMVHRKEGKLLFVSSVWGNVGASMEVAYSASKGGINSFTKALAKELAPSNIQVNAVAFGVIDTDMNRCFSEEEMEALREEIPADRIGTCEEAAEMILQVIQSPAYLTGQVITMDGGWI